MTTKLGIINAPTDWISILAWIPTVSSSVVQNLALIQVWQALIYELWKERNMRFHQGISLPFPYITSKVLKVVRHKSIALKNQGSKFGEPLMLWWRSHSWSLPSVSIFTSWLLVSFSLSVLFLFSILSVRFLLYLNILSFNENPLTKKKTNNLWDLKNRNNNKQKKLMISEAASVYVIWSINCWIGLGLKS